jgi:hypothetical protein
MNMTRKFRREAGAESNTPFYGFYVRLAGDARKAFVTTQERMTASMGGVPSNPMLLDELLRVYLGQSEGLRQESAK